MKLQMRDSISAKNIQLLYLLLGGGTVFLFVYIEAIFPFRGYFLAERWMTVPCLLFLGSALVRPLTPLAKRSLLLSVAAVIWFSIVQLQHEVTDMGTRSFGIFAFVYLLGFPFAAVMEDGKENKGMKLIGKVYVASALIAVLCTVWLITDTVPKMLDGAIFYDGARVGALWHPNVGACALMVGIGFSLYFFACAEKKWMKILMVILMILQFAAMALTNSRTSILLACGLVGGTIFFGISRGGWKRFAAGLAAAMAAILALFFLYDSLFELHSQNLLEKRMEQVTITEDMTADEVPDGLVMNEETGEISIATGSAQSDLSHDLKTFNGRTSIWKAAIQAMEDNPALKIWGTEYPYLEISSRNSFYVGHAHNAWIQTWMLLGTPALLFSLVYTLVAVVNAVWLMFRKNMEFSKKIVAMMVLCILAASVLEPYLFAGEMPTSFANFCFFFCTGYLMQWNADASEKG